VNAARVALTLAPEDESLRALLETATQKAAGSLAISHKARGAYEESNESWEAAAQAYERAAESAGTDPKLFVLAAESHLRAGTDARAAVRLARAAVALEPKTASHRLTLARANEAAGLVESAIGELDRALKLTPEDATIAPWITRLRATKR
jgi:tetratricopeptide (TPR) repeat protein